MKYLIFFFFLLFFTSGCGLREREQKLDKKMNELKQKEQELLLRENALQLKEDELAQREKLLDSTISNPADSFMILHPQIVGKWNVTMRCTETNCAGSAVGDTKNEQWEFSYLNNKFLVQAFSDNKLVRVYSGGNNNNAIELSTEADSTDTEAAQMLVRINSFEEKKMQGQREIIRSDDCRIVYALDFTKQ